MAKIKSTGKTTLTPNVILTIARMAALEVNGVMGMASMRPAVPKLKSKSRDGVNLIMEDDIVFLDLYLIIDGDHNIRDVSRNVQNQVSRSIAEMTGLEIGSVDIHIEDIQYQNSAV